MSSDDFEKCLTARKLIHAEAAKKLSANELLEAERDLQDAEDSFRSKKVKWATVQAYYSVFHALRSLLYAAGYRERSHWCTLVGVEELYVRRQKLLNKKDIRKAHHTMNLREDADYSSAYSEDGARMAVENARAFLKKVKAILGKAV